MIQLIDDCWKEFKQDGLLFEKLVGDLLNLEYPDKTFKKTQTTHDGSRDWELSIPLLHDLNADIWFECKYRKENLAADEIAMTLVMAYIEDARQIVFFSYSPVNRGFAKKISRFSERSKIPVSIYDDVSLESLILRHWNKLNTSEYFPDVKPRGEHCLSDGISAYYEVYKNGKLISCHNRNNLPVVRFNDILTVRVTLLNHSSQNDKNITVSINPTAESSFFICNESFISTCNKKSVFVPHNGISSFSIYLKLKLFGPVINLPSILLNWEDGQKMIFPGKIEGQWLAEAPLIGQVFHDVVLTQNKYMRNNIFTIFQIVGHSGVGKSRLVHEIMIQARVIGKRVYHLDNDLEKSNFFSFVRGLISDLEGLPEISSKKNLHVLRTNDQRQNMAIQILYNKSYLSEISLNELAAYLFKLMKQKETWLVLDNVQWMDESSLDLLNILLTYAGKTSSSGIFLSFNQDYLYSGTKADQLFKSIQSYSSQYHGSIQSIELTGFTYHDALHYLQECLTYKTKSTADELDYKETLTKVIDHCGTQPFYLQNMLIYLSQKHVLERTNETSFYLANIQNFWNHIIEIPKTVTALLEKRINLTIEHFKEKKQEQILYDLFIILSFCDSIPSILCRELFGTFSIKRELMELGLISVDGSGNISFYHQYFKQYFQRLYPMEQLPREILENFCAAVDRRQLNESMLESYYLAQYTLGTCEQALLKKVMKKIVNWQVSPRLSRAVKQAVFLQLENISEQLPDRLVASCYYAMCFITANREGMQNACWYYEKCYLDLLDGVKAYIKHRDLIFPLIREYLLSLGNLNRNLEAIDHANKLLSHYLSATEYCTIREILCISNYAIGKTTKAIGEIESALLCSPTVEDTLKLIQEYGKAYYFAPNAYKYQTLICEQWDKAFSIYQEKWTESVDIHDLSSLQRNIAVWLNSGISDLIQKNLMRAEEKMIYLSQYLDRTRMPFYEIKIRLFRAMVLLMRDMFDRKPGNSHKEICEILNKASDICVVYYNMQDYPVCFYLRASAQLYAGKYAEAIDNYKKTCSILQKHIDNEQEECIWSYFYEDMALRFVQLHVDFPQQLLEGIRGDELRERVRKLGNCDIPEDEIFQCDRSPILYENGPWGLPKI